MKIIHRLISKFKDHRGAAAVIVAISMAVLIGIAALAIDVGYVAITKNELHNIADATSLAAARQMGEEYSNLPPAEQQNYICDPSTIVSVVNEVAGKNKAGGEYITIPDADVIIGTWTGSMTPGLNQPNAVSVTAKRDESANNPITTFFAKIFGIDDIDVGASATAALTGLSRTEEVEIPLGISREWFEGGCEGPLTFRQNEDDAPCIAWHCFSSSKCSASDFKKELRGIIDGAETPEIIAGETEYDFRKGMYGVAFPLVEELFNDRKGDEEPYDEWTTPIVVYDFPCSTNINNASAIKIIGFATITITKILGPPDREIQAKIECEVFEPGRGGGGYYGTYGTIPGLVE